MDRSVLEGDPHSVIEGMALAAYAIGATRGFVYVRAEYPLAVSRLTKAIEHAKESGLLGENILGTGFNFDLEIRMGSGAFVWGEETALMTSIEDGHSMSRSAVAVLGQVGLPAPVTSLAARTWDAIVVGAGIYGLPTAFFLARLGWLKPSFFRNRWRYAILICTVLSAVITPTPDIYNMTLMAMPLLGLYFVSFLVVRAAAPRVAPQTEDTPP